MWAQKIKSREEILFCKSEGSYTTIVYSGKKKMVSKNLKSVQNILPSNIFYRCHPSYLINIYKLNRIDFVNRQVIIGDNRVPVSLNKARTFPDIKPVLRKNTAKKNIDNRKKAEVEKLYKTE